MAEVRRTAVVTGSTSGIGKAIAARLLASGYCVVLNYARDHDRAQQALAECREISPKVVLEQADVSRPLDAARLVARAVDAFGRLDVLVNNAAQVIARPALHMAEANWDRLLAVNRKSAFLSCSHAVA